jgi:hypothetical protein
MSPMQTDFGLAERAWIYGGENRTLESTERMEAPRENFVSHHKPLNPGIRFCDGDFASRMRRTAQILQKFPEGFCVIVRPGCAKQNR